MTHAEKCPICQGSGVLEGKGTNYIASGLWGDKLIQTNAIKKTCHGCQGKGWIKV